MKRTQFSVLLVICSLLLLFGLFLTAGAQETPLTSIEQLGKSLFFDENLSINGKRTV